MRGVIGSVTTLPRLVLVTTDPVARWRGVRLAAVWCRRPMSRAQVTSQRTPRSLAWRHRRASSWVGRTVRGLGRATRVTNRARSAPPAAAMAARMRLRLRALIHLVLRLRFDHPASTAATVSTVSSWIGVSAATRPSCRATVRRRTSLPMRAQSPPTVLPEGPASFAWSRGVWLRAPC
jgi:hypothetical protein